MIDPPTPGPLLVGDRIDDRYEIFEIHQGGMGVVYLARDPRGRPGREVVALKTLNDEFLPDPSRRSRFTAECRLWVKLGQHPNIVQALAVEEIGGRPFILLECVSGGELKQRIGDRALDPPRALRHGVELCLGLEHAIRQGLRCHRDIKPSNLLITGDGVLKLTDFGLAGLRDDFLAAEAADGPIPLDESASPQPIVWEDPRDRLGQARPASVLPARDPEPPPACPAPVEPPPDPDPPIDLDLDRTAVYDRPARSEPLGTTTSRLTRTGVLFGTLPYMAPEQFRDARSTDVRADIYSFGVVLYQMLTTELPFRGNTLAKLRRQHELYEPPSVVPAIPRRYAREADRIDGLVRRCLAKDPDDRYESVPELRRALTEALRRVDRG